MGTWKLIGQFYSFACPQKSTITFYKAMYRTQHFFRGNSMEEMWRKEAMVFGESPREGLLCLDASYVELSHFQIEGGT